LVGLRYASKAALLGAVWPPISLELDASSPFWPVAQGAATREISRNVHPAAQGAAQVATNSTDVNRGAAETGSAWSQVLGSAQSLARQSAHLRVEEEKFVGMVRAAWARARLPLIPTHGSGCGQLGKQANCQVAVSLSIANHAASLPLAYRLYLPKDGLRMTAVGARRGYLRTRRSDAPAPSDRMSRRKSDPEDR
jgi:hypothetical protein